MKPWTRADTRERRLLTVLVHITMAFPAADNLCAARQCRRSLWSRMAVYGALIEQHQTAVHGLGLGCDVRRRLRQMRQWAERLKAEGRFGEL